MQCKNCPKRFTPREKGGSPQLFCSGRCRREFHRNGSAFGALREKLPGYIAREVEKYLERGELVELLKRAGFVHRSQLRSGGRSALPGPI